MRQGAHDKNSDSKVKKGGGSFGTSCIIDDTVTAKVYQLDQTKLFTSMTNDTLRAAQDQLSIHLASLTRVVNPNSQD